MSVVQVSRTLRLALLQRFSNVFNGALQAACAEFQVDPPYSLNFLQASNGPQNFYEGNRSFDALNLLQEPDLPAMTMWTGEAIPYGPGQRQLPSIFSGSVLAHWRFFLSVKGLRSIGLIDLREATESAMIATLADEFSMPDCVYRGDIAWQALQEQQWVDQDSQHVGFMQPIEFSASFEVNLPS